MSGKIQYIIKKWYIVLLCALIGASALYFEKSSVKPSIPQNGDVTYTRLVRFDPVPVFVIGQDGYEIDINKALGMWGNRQKFIDVLDTEFVGEQISVGWNDLKVSEKFDWMNQHFRAGKIGPGVYELVLQIKKNEPKDIDYLTENGNRLMDAYESYVINSAKEITGNSQMSVIQNYSLIENEDAVQPETLVKKYSIIGFVLGAMVGITGLSIIAIKKSN